MHQRSVESDTCTAISPFPSCLEYVKVWDLSRKLCCDTSTLHPSFSLVKVSNSSRCRSAAVALLLTRLRASGQKSLVAMIPLRRRKKHKNCLGQVRKSRKASATIAITKMVARNRVLRKSLKPSTSWKITDLVSAKCCVGRLFNRIIMERHNP